MASCFQPATAHFHKYLHRDCAVDTENGTSLESVSIVSYVYLVGKREQFNMRLQWYGKTPKMDIRVSKRVLFYVPIINTHKIFLL